MKKWLGIMTMGAVVALTGCQKAEDSSKGSDASQTETAAPSTTDVKAATDNATPAADPKAADNKAADAKQDPSTQGESAAKATENGNAESVPVKEGAAPTAEDAKAATDSSAPATEIKGADVASMTEQQKASYALGVLMASNLKSELPAIQLEQFSTGLHDAYDNHASLSLQESKDTFLNFQHKTYQEMTEHNLKDGQAFAEKYAQQEGVKKTDSGILYKVLSSGNAKGAHPTDASNIEVSYEGRHIDGKVFDASENSGAFNVAQVISGWREVVKLMHVGDEWEVVIPADKAYGEQGTGEGTIAPNETLVFKIKLLNVSQGAKH